MCGFYLVSRNEMQKNAKVIFTLFCQHSATKMNSILKTLQKSAEVLFLKFVIKTMEKVEIV